jgi:hypothetical protein
MKLVRKFMMPMGIQFQTIYIKSETISEALEYCRKYHRCVAQFIAECPDRMTYDIEL